MQKRQLKQYSQTFKEQVVKEALDIGSVSAVARKHNMPATSIYTWIKKNSPKKTPGNLLSGKCQGPLQDGRVASALQLKKKLMDAELEIRVLKELLKKTNLAWLKD